MTDGTVYYKLRGMPTLTLIDHTERDECPDGHSLTEPLYGGRYDALVVTDKAIRRISEYPRLQEWFDIEVRTCFEPGCDPGPWSEYATNRS